MLKVHELAYGPFGPHSFTVEPGHCLGVSGPSGCGKTRLLRALCDLDPATGEVALNGQRAETVPAPLWRRRMGLLPAEPAWWADQVARHFESTPDPALLGRLGFSTDVLEWEISRLSSGEKQRLSLLRTLLLQPECLLLDEPTAHLDPAYGAAMETLIAEYRRTAKVPVVWVSHTADQLARVADRRMMFVDGRLEEQP